MIVDYCCLCVPNIYFCIKMKFTKFLVQKYFSRNYAVIYDIMINNYLFIYWPFIFTKYSGVRRLRHILKKSGFLKNNIKITDFTIPFLKKRRITTSPKHETIFSSTFFITIINKNGTKVHSRFIISAMFK